MNKHILAALILVSVLMACGGSKKTESTGMAGTVSGTVLAKVDGVALTLEDLQLQFPIEYRDQVRGKDLQDAIETWINTQLLARAGIKKGLDKDPAVEAIMRFRKSDAVARRLIELEITGKTLVSQADIDSVYSADRETYKIDKDRLRASHILVASNDEAKAIYNRLKKGDDFAKLANEYSGDRQSAANGGDLGYFAPDQIDPDFAKAALRLKMGEYSEPVKTSYGYHIIKLTDRLVAGSSLDSVEVKGKISEGLLTSRRAETFQTFLDSLKKDAKIERFTPPGLDLPAVQDSV